jgi:hypothetical protein
VPASGHAHAGVAGATPKLVGQPEGLRQADPHEVNRNLPVAARRLDSRGGRKAPAPRHRREGVSDFPVQGGRGDQVGSLRRLDDAVPSLVPVQNGDDRRGIDDQSGASVRSANGLEKRPISRGLPLSIIPGRPVA